MTVQKRYEMGERIRECRKQRKLSQAQMAEIIGISNNAFSNIETGNSNATLENVKKIAEYFQVSLDYLTDGEERTLEDEIFIRRYLELSKEDRGKMMTVMNTFFPKLA